VSASALFVDGHAGLVELLGLVLEVDRDLAKSCFVLTRMVRAEQ
jgi:prepilin-type processing-associated H-X9-DG protein